MSQAIDLLPNKTEVENLVTALTINVHALLLIGDGMRRTIAGNAITLIADQLEVTCDKLRDEFGLGSAID